VVVPPRRNARCGGLEGSRHEALAQPAPLREAPVTEITMRTMLWAVSLMQATVIPFGADASELEPVEAGTFVLGAHTVSVYPGLPEGLP
jgi:hypothetical protein